MNGTRSAFLPIAIVFGLVSVVSFANGKPLWIAFFPIAVTFGILSFTRSDNEGDASEAGVPPGDHT